MGENLKKTVNPDRNKQEEAEALKEQHVDAPKSRFQDTQQVNDAASANKAETPEVSFIKKPAGVKGSQLKQEIASAVVSSSSSGGRSGSNSEIGSPAKYGLKSLTYSGDTGTILGNASDTPVMGQSNQGKTRVDKRLSDPNKDINYIASEQIVVEYENVKPLAGNDSTVGYNGNPKNTSARSQKTSGGSSAELLFDRSLDFIEDDAFIFAHGQVVKQKDVQYDDYPTKTSYSAGSLQKAPVDITLTRGNFAPRNIKIGVSVDSNDRAYISSFEVEEDDLSANNESYKTVNDASANEKIFINKSELARQRIDSKCGSPSQDHFNPLGRSVEEPTATVGYLRDVEATTGATLFAAYKFANKARAYYLMRTMKDGQDLEGPAIDAMYGHLMTSLSRDDMMASYKAKWSTEQNKSPLISKAGMAAGSAAILLPLFDSPSKYKTKADIITQPRGFKLHYQTADNNINPFRVERNFVAALNSVDVFSTIDRGYDPMSSICCTDGVRLVYPYSWNKALKFTRSAAGQPRVYNDELFAYVYSAGNGLNQYAVKVADPVLNGLAYFAEMHANELADALGAQKGRGEVIWNIPTVHYGCHFGLWDLLLCAISPYVVYERTNSLKDILDYEVNFEYPFDLVTIGDANPMNAVNYVNIDSLSPLTSKTMLPSSAIRWCFPEIMRPVGDQAFMLPYYFSENDYAPQGTDATHLSLKATGAKSFTTPVIRAGVRLAYLDDFFNMETKDAQLCLDRLVRVPLAKAANPGPDLGLLEGVVYKYSQDAEGIPVVTNASAITVRLQDYLATPRQLGWFMPAPAGTCRRDAKFQNEATKNDIFAPPCVAAGTFNIGKSGTMVAPATRAKMYKGLNTVAPAKQLGDGSVVINRSQSFTQKWYLNTASGNKSDLFDLPLSIASMVTGSNGAVTGVRASEQFTPFIFASYEDKGALNVYDKIKLFSIHHTIWPLIQKLPFVINPFDVGVENGGYVDPFSFAYCFGLAGFMAADYAEEVYNRTNQIMNQGFGFTVDPFVKDSPVFKDAYSATQV